jgi:hypothetical protein
MDKLGLLLLSLLTATLLSGSFLARSSGALPGQIAPIDAARQAPSCTACHSGTIGSNGVATLLTAPHHSLDRNESIQLALQVTGGPSGSDGGFAAENTAGTFSAGTNTQTNTSGRPGQFLTHTNDSSRSWSLGYTAPNTPGLVRIFAVTNSANGSGTSNDSISFHGFDPTSTTCTPVYLGVNAIGNQRFGSACVGGFGNWPVLYSDLVPTVGNAAYGVKLAGVAPGSGAVFVFGVPRATPIDLGPIGVNGCGLWVDSLVNILTGTTAGNAQRGEGTASVPAPVPAVAALQGSTIGAQAAVLDSASGRSLPLTLSNGLRITIQ